MRNLRHRHERGAALIEAAFVIPFFALILSAVFELGRLLYFFQILTSAAYEGARFASQLPQMAIGCFDKDHTNLDKNPSIQAVSLSITILRNLSGEC